MTYVQRWISWSDSTSRVRLAAFWLPIVALLIASEALLPSYWQGVIAGGCWGYVIATTAGRQRRYVLRVIFVAFALLVLLRVIA